MKWMNTHIFLFIKTKEKPNHGKNFKKKIHQYIFTELSSERYNVFSVVLVHKNTRTIWHFDYWTKFDRKIMNKRSRKNAKLDLMNGDDKPFKRYKYQQTIIKYQLNKNGTLMRYHFLYF